MTFREIKHTKKADKLYDEGKDQWFKILDGATPNEFNVKSKDGTSTETFILTPQQYKFSW